MVDTVGRLMSLNLDSPYRDSQITKSDVRDFLNDGLNLLAHQIMSKVKEDYFLTYWEPEDPIPS